MLKWFIFIWKIIERQYFNIVHFKGDTAQMTILRSSKEHITTICVCSVHTTQLSYIGRLFTGAESERAYAFVNTTLWLYDRLQTLPTSSDSGRRERPERTHSALFQLISCRNIVDLCERVCIRGWLRNNGNKNSVNLGKRYSRVSSIKYSAYVWPHFFSPSTMDVDGRLRLTEMFHWNYIS